VLISNGQLQSTHTAFPARDDAPDKKQGPARLFAARSPCPSFSYFSNFPKIPMGDFKF
jgi:hypothetical protein